MPAELRKPQGQGVIETVQEEGGIIEWSDKRGGANPAPLSGLEDQMSWARKKISHRENFRFRANRPPRKRERKCIGTDQHYLEVLK